MSEPQSDQVTEIQSPASQASVGLESLPEAIRQAMQERGFSELTAIQQTVLSEGASNRNLRISSQTGSGKTVAIGLALAPSLTEAVAEKGPQQKSKGDGNRIKKGKGGSPLALIIAPTRELAVQVCGELSWMFAKVRGLQPAVVTGGSDIRREQKVLSRNPVIVVGTPGRLLDHIRHGHLRLENCEHVVLDEADQMLDMGFKDELDAIVETLPEKRHSHLVSATFPRAVQRFADSFQENALHLQGTKLGQANADIEHTAYLVQPRDRYGALVNLLLAHPDERCLIFVERRIDAAQIAEHLGRDGFAALPFSGDLAQSQRTRTLQAFRSGMISILVATDVAARGIDISDISMVIHLDRPDDAETYTHRSGRTGRAGKKGRSLILVPPRGQRHIEQITRQARIHDVQWSPVPSPQQIFRAAKKRGRKAMHETLQKAEAPDENFMAYAKDLLESYDAATLVAHLVKMTETKLPRQPMDVATLQYRETPKGQFHDRGEDRPRGRGRRGPYRGARPHRRSGSRSNDSTSSRRGDSHPRKRASGKGFDKAGSDR